MHHNTSAWPDDRGGTENGVSHLERSPASGLRDDVLAGPDAGR